MENIQSMKFACYIDLVEYLTGIPRYTIQASKSIERKSGGAVLGLPDPRAPARYILTLILYFDAHPFMPVKLCIPPLSRYFLQKK